VRTSIVRLPQVHGRGGGGFVKFAIEIAKDKGWAFTVGNGQNRWPAAHVNDVARLYRLALEKAEPGARFHAVAEEGIATAEIAETIGWGLGLPVRRLTPEEAPGELGFLGMFAGFDIPASSAWTRKTLGWTPVEPELIPQLRDRSMGYFD
jgi:nucleoside-diphosphate-sugar epimerase